MSFASGRSLAVTVAIAVALAAIAAGRAASATVRGPFTVDPVRELAAHATAVAAIISTTEGPQVLLLARDRAGDPMAVVGRWPEDAGGVARDDRRVQQQRSRSDVDDTLWLYDLSDADRDSWVLDDLLELEGLDDRERRGKGSPPDQHQRLQSLPRALAAAGTEMWMATSRGLWRLEGRGAAARWQPRGLNGRDVSQLAVELEDGVSGQRLPVVTAVAGGTRWRSIDRGATWHAGGLATSAPAARTRGGDRRPPRRRALPTDVTATAVTGDEIWIGTTRGLYAADAEDDLDAWRAAGLLRDTVAGQLAPGGAAESTSDPRPSWFRHVPRVAVEVGTRMGAGRLEVRGLVVVTIPLARALP